ncbi:glutamyl-tRNA(Gln) amidotransferase subunit C, mitochondrial [Aplysia californica]|uniref:Glutamyl-tRNA(Gln) amidotransferase subunit C, mitochondrial n=1 Tax=Aplysia californica TaxID=6500 RepID=A0ABM0JS58_APLCA|nr:glutamyl-tRNA(Gln) amidotransferase subunit C, mitochondrial [Aplysia californica]
MQHLSQKCLGVCWTFARLRAVRQLSSKVPPKPTWEKVDFDALPKVPEVDLALVEQLERISLVEFNNETGLEWLRSSVKSANRLHVVDTEGVEPLDNVLEDRELWLCEDQVTEGNCTEQVLLNALKTEEQYFVAPPGNVPLKKRDKQHLKLGLQEDEDSS